MKIEHIAFNVDKVREAANWYVAHLDMRIVRDVEAFPFPIFLADATGETVLEFYRNDQFEIPNYFDLSVWTLHIAFNVKNIHEFAERLIKNGATPHEGITIVASGDRAGFVRDPNGIPLQLIERIEPLL